jgi:hypothetical protein
MLLSAPDGTPRVGATFAPELRELRSKQGHTTISNLHPGAALPAGRCTEMLVEFNPAPHAKAPYGVQLVGDITILYDPVEQVVHRPLALVDHLFDWVVKYCDVPAGGAAVTLRW